MLWHLSVNFPDRLFNSSDASLAVKRCGHTRDSRTVLGQNACITKKTKNRRTYKPPPPPPPLHRCQCLGFLTSALVTHTIIHRGCTIIAKNKNKKRGGGGGGCIKVTRRNVPCQTFLAFQLDAPTTKLPIWSQNFRKLISICLPFVRKD